MTEKKTAMHQRVFTIEWGDMDALGHVNNGRYFDYFQQARIDHGFSFGIQVTAIVCFVLNKHDGTRQLLHSVECEEQHTRQENHAKKENEHANV